jgi:hypothetical protein
LPRILENGFLRAKPSIRGGIELLTPVEVRKALAANLKTDTKPPGATTKPRSPRTLSGKKGSRPPNAIAAVVGHSNTVGPIIDELGGGNIDPIRED